MLAGFAAETQDVLEGGRHKLISKQVNFIFANDVGSGQVFGSETNQITALCDDGSTRPLGKGSKRELAAAIVALIAERC